MVSLATEPVHVLTLTPFFPSAGEETKGCFVDEPLRELRHCDVVSTVIAAQPIYHPWRRPDPNAPAQWVRYPQFPGNWGLSSAGRLLYARLLTRVRRLHGEQPVDVIHAHSALPCGHAAALLARDLDVPFVVTLHGLDVFNATFTDGTAALWRRQASCSVYRQAQTVICISEKVRQNLMSGFENEVRSAVVYNGADPELFTPGLPVRSAEIEVLIVGNLLLGKGHGLVFRAIDRLRNTYPQVRCRIIGEGPDRDRFAALARNLRLEGQIQFLGSKSRPEVAEAMRGCAVFALPARFEALGCVYLEAMSCGKPVIACRGQGIDEIIRHRENGWLVPEDGLEELVDAFSVLFKSPDLRARIGAAARRTILDSLTLSHQAQRLAEIYRGAIE
jgi:teichuronic acid biosynthesis glycosyltransferase TuaC